MRRNKEKLDRLERANKLYLERVDLEIKKSKKDMHKSDLESSKQLMDFVSSSNYKKEIEKIMVEEEAKDAAMNNQRGKNAIGSAGYVSLADEYMQEVREAYARCELPKSKADEIIQMGYQSDR